VASGKGGWLRLPATGGPSVFDAFVDFTDAQAERQQLRRAALVPAFSSSPPPQRAAAVSTFQHPHQPQHQHQNGRQQGQEPRAPPGVCAAFSFGPIARWAFAFAMDGPERARVREAAAHWGRATATGKDPVAAATAASAAAAAAAASAAAAAAAEAGPSGSTAALGGAGAAGAPGTASLPPALAAISALAARTRDSNPWAEAALDWRWAGLPAFAWERSLWPGAGRNAAGGADGGSDGGPEAGNLSSSISSASLPPPTFSSTILSSSPSVASALSRPACRTRYILIEPARGQPIHLAEVRCSTSLSKTRVCQQTNSLPHTRALACLFASLCASAVLTLAMGLDSGAPSLQYFTLDCTLARSCA